MDFDLSDWVSLQCSVGDWLNGWRVDWEDRDLRCGTYGFYGLSQWLYIGITNDLNSRICEHLGIDGGRFGKSEPSSIGRLIRRSKSADWQICFISDYEIIRFLQQHPLYQNKSLSYWDELTESVRAGYDSLSQRYERFLIHDLQPALNVAHASELSTLPAEYQEEPTEAASDYLGL